MGPGVSRADGHRTENAGGLLRCRRRATPHIPVSGPLREPAGMERTDSEECLEPRSAAEDQQRRKLHTTYQHGGGRSESVTAGGRSRKLHLLLQLHGEKRKSL